MIIMWQFVICDALTSNIFKEKVSDFYYEMSALQL